MLVLGLVAAAASLTTRSINRPVISYERESAAGPAETTQHAFAAVNRNGEAGGRLRGIATFYADDFHLQRMANGEIFDMHNPTVAASNVWPLGTKLEVKRVAGSPWDKNLSKDDRSKFIGKTIIVTVTDRGEFGHLLDLSYGAFGQLARHEEGVINVEVTPIDWPEDYKPNLSGLSKP